MGRDSKKIKLKVYSYKKFVGTLTKAPDSSISFQYENDWIDDKNCFAISTSLPLSIKPFYGEEVSFYFDNLLPDSQKIRRAVAEKFGAASTRHFDLINVIGKDCVGSLMFLHVDEELPDLSKMKVTLLNEKSIAEKIRGLEFDSPLGMQEGDFRLSLAGAQEKMALTYYRNNWYEPKSFTPTSHIMKKKMANIMGKYDFSSSIDNEWICLWLCRKFGIKSANAKIEEFEDQKIISVERFDRFWHKKIIYRIPQEDMCQALGVSSLNKFERSRGPSIKDFMDILLSSISADEDRKDLFKAVIFYDLLHNTDAHAKNFSLMLTKHGYKLTPMYDVLSAHFLRDQDKEYHSNLKSVLSVNGKFQYKEITKYDWYQEAKNCDLNKEVVDEIFNELRSSLNEFKFEDSELDEKLDHKNLTTILEGLKERAAVVLGECI